MLQIAVVEDEELYLQQMQDFIRRYGEESGEEIEVSAFRDGTEILRHYRPIYDIIFLDIEMPGTDGMSAAQEIRKFDGDVVLLFVTNMAQYAIEGYSVGALDFVLKPVNYTTFALKFRRAISQARQRERGQVLLALHEGIKRLDTRQIYYVEVQNRMLQYHTDEGIFSLRGTMQSAEKELSPHHFVRCNHWYLVNLRHVTEIRKDTVLVAGDELEISRRSKTAFLTALTNYMGGGGGQ